ncbi:hypothetical protein ACWT_3967 [Actinoplanes sp. SE50]|uniref:hypothetical protein n=1 Tax=unclassified Actinoplanes TaxID=2626549 RepID=UPI00023ED453|nr:MULTISPECIES: hypothetical protein [unclassified Actinoplanes]AEV84991.1 hypothetical protein ACPL_4096 [Actinoplanes sp. SE50/110]ATO83382.1 hypothetical protein ACWT_3967 [Actinoplanes sp. SE50]SLM00789.1 hypothetical protein ACSP50_4022 [Actinoplanes sp. SE50/110]
MSADFAAADRFLQAEGRLLDRRLFATLFRGASPDGVVDALRGYRNADGGFGHGLEPDKRCPASLPIDVEVAFQALAAAGVADPGLLGPACDFLTTVTKDGAVPLAFPVIEDHPRAAHWTDWTYEPGVNPTAGLAGLLHQLGFAHPWLDTATSYCWTVIESGRLPEETHALSELLVFLTHVPDRPRAERSAESVLAAITGSELFQTEPRIGAYGLTPLHVAPTAGSPWRALFEDAQLDAHLEALAAAQQDDGGWPVTWEPPSAAALLDWRGHVTLQAVRTLTSYGKPG